MILFVIAIIILCLMARSLKENRSSGIISFPGVENEDRESLLEELFPEEIKQ